MKFVIAKPIDKMSTGDLFYSAPRKSEIDKACDELFQICLRRADREFPRHSDYPERNGMVPQVEKELRMIQNSELAFVLLVMHEIVLLSKVVLCQDLSQNKMSSESYFVNCSYIQ